MSEIEFWFKVHLIWALVIIVIALLVFVYNMERGNHE